MSSRMRVTKGHRNNRRSHHGVEMPAITVDKESKTPHLRHRANPVTGMYRGRKVIDNANAVAPKEEVKAEATEKESTDKKEK